MAILNHGSTIRTADGGQSITTIVTANNIGSYAPALNSIYYVGTTQNVFNRASAAQTLTGVSIDGNAATVTNGVYTTGTQTIGGAKTFSDGITVNTAKLDFKNFRQQLRVMLDIPDITQAVWPTIPTSAPNISIPPFPPMPSFNG